MKFFGIFLLFLGVGGMVKAQPGIQWQKTLGGSLHDQSKSVQQTSDGGYVAAGYTNSEDGDIESYHGFYDVWVTRFDAEGAVLWKNTFGGSSFEEAFAVLQTSDGGFVVAGYTQSNDGDVSGNHGNSDAWVFKLDSLGNLLWQKCLGGTYNEEAWDIRQATDGGFILTGHSSSFDGDLTGNNGALDYWIVKLSSTGNIEWQRTIGGSDYDWSYSISPTTDGGYIVAGESQSNDGDVAENPTGLDAWIVKLNFEGKIEWQKSLVGNGRERINEIHQTREGGYILLGFTDSSNGDVVGLHGVFYDFWAVKLNNIGQIEWQKPLGGSGEDYGQSIWQTTDGGFVATGFINSTDGDVTGNHGSSDLWVVKLSEEGELLWQKAFGGSLQEAGYSIRQTTDGGYIVAGSAWSSDGDVPGAQGRTDFWIVKLSPESTPTTNPPTQTLQLYPNPAQNTLSLKIPETIAPNAALSLQITDLLGREVLQKSVFDGGLGSVDLDIAKLPGGLYWVQASSLEGEVFVGKFQKLD